MAISLVQSKGHGTSSASSVTVTLASTTGGNCLVALVASYNPSSGRGPSLPTNWMRLTGSTYHQNDYYDFLATDCYLYPNNPGGITSVPISFSATASSACAIVMEWSGLATSSPIDGTPTLVDVNPNTKTPSTTYTAGGGGLVIGCCIKDDGQNGAGTLTQPSSPWSTSVPSGSTLAQNDSIGGVGMGIAYIAGSASGSIIYDPTNTITTDYTLYEFGLLAAGGGGAAAIPDLIMAPMVAS